MGTCSEEGTLSVSLEFLGATDGIVTGSANLVTITRGNVTRRILVDYGWFQGDHEYLNEERTIYGSDIDCVLLTHAHLDHCGGIPLLFNTGDHPYEGEIFGSRETLNQAEHILRDSAKLNSKKLRGFKNGFKRVKREITRRKEKAEREDASAKELANYDSAVSSIEEVEEEVLFTIDDVEEAIEHFHPIDFTLGEQEIVEISLFEGIDAKFIPITHINGSTLIELTAHLGCDQYTIAFTGDVGNRKTVLYREHSIPKNRKVDALVLESLHSDYYDPVENLEESTIRLRKIIKRAVKKQKTVIIPVFALDRSAGIIKVLNDFMDQGMYLQCYLDSPLAEKELYEYISSYKEGRSVWFNYDQPYPFNLDRFHIISNFQDHALLSKYNGPNVIITSSCMGYGGRIIDYFAHHIQDPNSVFVFPGYLPEESPSRVLLEADKGKMVELSGNRFIKRCDVYQLHGFSSHGYFDDKMAIIDAYPNLSTIFLNHGDEYIYGLQESLSSYSFADIIVPEYESYYTLL